MLLSFVKFQVKLSNCDGTSKHSAIILDFWISQSSVATQLRWGGRPCLQLHSVIGNMTMKEFYWSTLAKVMVKSQMYCVIDSH